MRSDDFGFKSNDVSNLDRIIEALNELVSLIRNFAINSFDMYFNAYDN